MQRISFWVARSLVFVAALTGAAWTHADNSVSAAQLSQTRVKKVGDVDPMRLANDGNLAESPTSPQAVQVAGNYTFATSTSASLVDMSSGTTTLIATDQDDTASSVTLIGFDFYFQGVRQDRFSVNSNGSLRFGATPISNTLYDPLAQAGVSLITAYGADQRTHAGNGKVHIKAIGAAPNRELVIEWLNMQADFNSGGTADLTYQVHLFETSGVIEFAYGSMAMSATGAGDPNSQSPQIGFSSNNAAGSVGSITAAQSGTPAPTFDGSSATPVNNVYVAGPIAVLSSTSDGSRRSFTLTPPTVSPPVGPLTFTGVTVTSMTLNWADSANETGYAIYQSTDGTTYQFYGTAAQNATSFTATNLLGTTTYFWQVVAVSEGDTAGISGSQPTAIPTPNASLGSGLWSSPATWSTGSVPSANDAITISSGTTVTIDTGAVGYSLSVGGTLQFEQTTARALTLGRDAVIQNGGTFQSNPAGTQTSHTLSLAGNLTNNGTLDFSTNADTAGAAITFTGTPNTTFDGSGATTDVRLITVNKGAGASSILELKPASFSVRGVTTDTVVGGWLTLANGTLKLSGTFSGTSRVFTAAGYTIPATAGVWLNNPNYTIAGQASSPTLNGLLHVSQGTINIGTATGNTMGFATGSTVVIEGGAVNVTGRFGVAASANTVSYTQSGGVITVCTIGNASATLGSFDLGTSLASTISLSGGTIVAQLAATAIDYRNQAGGGSAGVTGATLQLGNAASGAAKTFNLRGVLPNVTVTNTSAGHTAVMSTTLVNYNNFALSIAISPTATFNAGNTTFLMAGSSLLNNGTLTANGASSNFVWFDIGQGAQTYSGSGVTTAPITSMSIQSSGLTLASTNPIVANRINVFTGNIVNSNLLTLGIGNTATNVIQIGNTTTPTAAGTFDLPLTFNLGTGGEVVSYLRTTASRTTGPEINPSRALTNFTYDDNDPTHTLTIGGGDLAVNTTTTLTNGRVVTGSSVLTTGTTVTRTNGYVDGNLRKALAAAGSAAFEVGTANGYTPVVFNATAGTFPANATVAAIQSKAPNITPPEKAINRYWNITAPGVTADVTFSYLDPTDLDAAIEANLDVYRMDGNAYTDLGAAARDAAANTVQATGVTTFGLFTLGEPGETTPQHVDLSITKTDGVTTVTAGGSTTYTITASNIGPDPAPGATIADAFPPSLTCSWTCTGAGGGTCFAAGSGDISDLVNLPSGGSVTYTATCAISPSASGTLSNIATVSAPATVTDDDPANNSASDTDTIVSSADLAITKTDGVTSATPGGSVTYTITASNAGPSNTIGATIADTFPASLTCSWTCTGTSGGTCTASGSGNINDITNLPAGGSTTYTASCSIASSATGPLSNTATVSAPSGVTDPTPGNNTATDTDTLSPVADVAITNTDGVTNATPGSNVVYTVTASNAGPSDASGATVSDTFPTGATCSWTCVGAGGGTCTASGSGNINALTNLPSGGSVTYTATCSLPRTLSGTLVNTATVSAPSGVTDPTPGNNSATDTDTINPAATLNVVVDDGHEYARVGQMRNYLLKVSNNGPSDASDIAITETLSTAFVAEATQWICIGADPGSSCTASGSGPLTDSNVTIPASRSLTWLVTALVSSDTPDATADNTFVVTSQLDVASPYSVTDSDTVVIFRDSFDVPFGDGSDFAPTANEQSPALTALARPLVAGESLAFTMPETVGKNSVDVLVSGRAPDRSAFRVERLNLGENPSVRVVSIDVLGIEHASAWSIAQNGAHVVIGLLADTGTQAVLETASSETTLTLSAQTREAYQVQAADVAAYVVE